MKKLLVLLLALVLCVSAFASCNLQPAETTPAETTPAETTPAETTPAETTPAETTPAETTPAETTPAETTPEETTPGDDPVTPPEESGVEAAANYIYALYQNKKITAADFEVTAKVAIEGIVYAVEWSVDTDKVVVKTNPENKNVYVIDVNETSLEEVAYVLTATVTDGVETATKSFNLTVPEFVVNTFEEYMAAQKDETVTVAGIVVAINSKAAGNKYNHLFLADVDGKGGYYCYSIAKDPIADLGIELGMVVAVTGPIAPYSGMQEIKGGDAIIIDSNKHDVAVLDITDKVLNGESLANYVGLPVTMKGVEITTQELGGTSEYLKFKLGETTSYIRTYVTDFPTTLPVDQKSVIDAAHAEHFGWNANVTGILVLYNSAPYLIPMGTDCFEYLSAPQKSDAEKVTDALGLLTLGNNFSADAVVELPATSTAFADVLLTWASNSEFAVVADGKLTITVPDAATEAVITVTATCGEATGTKEFTIKLSKTATPIKDIIAIGAAKDHNTYTESKYLVAGIITEVYNDQYGNMYITDELGNVLTIYGTYSADGSTKYGAMESKPVAGDYVVIFGVVGQYNGTPQVKNGWIMSFTTPTSVKDAIDTGVSMGHNTYTENKVIVSGVITEVYQTVYGNMKITDAEGNILTIYGTYSSDGSLRYDALTVKPVAGDTVVIYGILGQYNGTAQIKNGWIVAHTAATPETPETPENPENPELTLDLWKSDESLFVVEGLNIKYNGAGNTYACVGSNVADLAAGKNTFTVTVTNNGAADSRVRFDLQCSVQVGNHKVCNVTAVGGDVWTDMEWGGSVVTVPAGQSVTLVITYDETTERGAVVDLVIFVDGARGDANTYNADVTLSGMSFTLVEAVVEPEVPAADSTLTVEQVIALGSAQEHNVYTEGKYYVTGVITEVYNTQYGNMKITDGNGNILTIYGTYSADGTVRYDALEVKPVAGDTITVYGIVGQYSGTPQVKNGWITAHTAATPETPDTPAAPTTKEIYEAAAKLENNVNLDGTYTMTGVIASVDTAYDAGYQNVTVTFVVDGYAFKCYRLKGEGADVIAAGDTITVTGTITAWYNAPQFAQGCTLVSYEKGEEKPADPSSLTLSFATTANRTEFSTEKQVWSQNGITVTNNKAASTSNVADYSKPGRFYKSSEVIIECAGMTKIEINCFGLDSKYVNPWLSVSNGTATLENGVVTIVFETPVDSLVYAAMSAQGRAYDITVYTQG